MRQTCEKIAGQLNAANKTVPLICVFNEISETCLSRALQDLIAPRTVEGAEDKLWCAKTGTTTPSPRAYWQQDEQNG